MKSSDYFSIKSANLLAISNANCLIATAMAFNLWNLARRFLVLLDNLSNNITKMEHKTERNKKREETRREHKEHTESKFFTSFTINLAELFSIKAIYVFNFGQELYSSYSIYITIFLKLPKISFVIYFFNFIIIIFINNITIWCKHILSFLHIIILKNPVFRVI